MKKSNISRGVIGTFSTFFTFFLLAAFVTTCCIMLFVTTLQNSIMHSFTEEEITFAAKATMLNVITLSLGMAAIDYLRRKHTVEKPVKRITEATERMIEGDFSVRIEHVSKFATGEHFNDIIECINKMAEELSGLETLRTDFIANVSHEMKTPLAVIHNYGMLLSSEDLSSDKRIEYAGIIIDSSKKLSDMMTNILKLTRLENQSIYPEAKKFDLGEQLCECLILYESEWERKNITIRTDIDEDVTVCADRELLTLVWNNLFSNAFKFTEGGGEVTLDVKRDGEYATVRISDTGCGMSAEVGAHIFEKFYQADPSRSTAGNGLGLALVKRVIDIVEAEISVESTVGVGTTVTVKVKRGEDGL